MGRKKKDRLTKAERQSQAQKRPKGKNRAEVVLAIVATDSTFRLADDDCWIGRCIHCNTKVFVLADGSTAATLEHIKPLCDGGEALDVRNLALACARCNNEKGVRHDRFVGKGGRADEVVAALLEKRMARWQDPT